MRIIFILTFSFISALTHAENINLSLQTDAVYFLMGHFRKANYGYLAVLLMIMLIGKVVLLMKKLKLMRYYVNVLLK